jgi:uncharacterized protein YjbI with pentapeptide repeats
MLEEQQSSIKVNWRENPTEHTSQDPTVSSSTESEVKQLWERLGKTYESSDKCGQEYDVRLKAKKLSADLIEYQNLDNLPSEPHELLPPADTSWRRAWLREKKLWDTLKLLAVSAALVAGFFYLQEHTKQRENDGYRATKEREQELATDNARQESLNKYYDIMTALLFDRQLRTSKESDEVRTIARTRTLTTLQSLDSKRKGLLLLFLQEARLIERERAVISLNGANLSGANLSGTNLYRSNLSSTNLSGADLSDINLSGANLSNVNLNGANLSSANLNSANLNDANLEGVNFSNANLNGVRLSNTNLEYALQCKTILPNTTISNRDCKKLGIPIN